jgi:hypothetical protein
MKLLIMKFSPFPCHIVPLRPKYTPRHPILENISSGYKFRHLFISVLELWNFRLFISINTLLLILVQSTYYNTEAHKSRASGRPGEYILCRMSNSLRIGMILFPYTELCISTCAEQTGPDTGDVNSEGPRYGPCFVSPFRYVPRIRNWLLDFLKICGNLSLRCCNSIGF